MTYVCGQLTVTTMNTESWLQWLFFLMFRSAHSEYRYRGSIPLHRLFYRSNTPSMKLGLQFLTCFLDKHLRLCQVFDKTTVRVLNLSNIDIVTVVFYN